MAKTKSTKKSNHLFHKFPARNISERQSPVQPRYGEGNEFWLICALLLLCRRAIVEFEVLEVWEEPDEVEDLPARTSGVLESEGTKCLREAPEGLLDVCQNVGYLEVIHHKFLEVHERGKVTQGTIVESERSN